MASKNIRVYYRASSHVPLWQVMTEGGFLEQHGLTMDLGSMEGLRTKAMEGLRAGGIDIVSGNHHNLYARRALFGEPFVHVAQSNNRWRENCLVATEGVDAIQDLKGQEVVMDDLDGHTGLNVWLYLRLNGLEEGRDVKLINGERRASDRIRQVMEGQYAATFVRAVDRVRAMRLNANVIDLPDMPMIEGVTLTTTTTYVNQHPEEIRALLMALVDGIHFFKTQRDATIEMIRKLNAGTNRFESEDEINAFYDDQVRSLEPKPYPAIDAIRNVFALAVKLQPELERFNPLVMWDLHHLREIDDSGYIDRLWQN